MLVPAAPFRFFTFLVAFFALIFPVAAQDATPAPADAPLKMAISSPFALTTKPLLLLVRQGKWFPVAVTLSNAGDAVTGEVHLKLLGGGGAPANDFVCPVDLPTNAHKVVWLYGRLERSNIAALEVSFSGRGFDSLIQRVPVQEPNDDQRVVLTISDVDSGLSDALRSLRGPGFSISGAVTPAGLGGNTSQGPLRPLESARNNVPDRWFGLEIADLVILGDFPHNALTPPQIESLRGYVAGGGRLLALGGANAPRLASSPLAALWPAAVASSGTASPGEVAEVVSRYAEARDGAGRARALSGADKLGGSPVVVARGALQNGAQLRAGSAQNPLFSLRDEGAGRVLLLGFDPSQPPFNGWSGQSQLWREILNAGTVTRHLDSIDSNYVSGFNGMPGGTNGQSGFQPNFGLRQNNSATAQLLGTLSKARQRDTPPVSQIAWFLALYVFVLVPLNYAVLRFIDRRELAWISIPVIVAAFSIFAYSAALSIRGKDILTRQMDIVQSSIGSKTARTDSLLWIFSPKTTTYTLASAIPNAAVADYVNESGVEQGAFSVLQPAEVASFQAKDAPVRIWSDRAFSAQSVPALRGGVTRVGDTIKNDTPFDLQGAVWIQDREIRALGTLSSGGNSSIPTRALETVNGPDFPGAIARASHLDTIFDKETINNNIPNSALVAALGEGFGRQNEGSFFVAWAKKPVAPLSIGTSGASSNDVTLFIFRASASISTKNQNTKTLAAREAIVTRVSGEAGAPGIGAPGVSASAGTKTDFFNCFLPLASRYKVEARGVGATAMPQDFAPRIAPGAPISRGALPVWIHIEALDQSRNFWVALPGKFTRDASPIAGWNFSAPIPLHFLRKPDRFLQIRVRRDNVSAQVSSLRVLMAA
ncbi:putative membrane protein [Abditibacterium utsteinense]|uniref:Putative membrane protein n=1 Tax=Abditibacterium utsteinense TaxID=1960156 RepID=A0A2S8SVX6_9BACT|nr:hypothetical protein [Abditibacterium utsteinense]PQV64942.1 putative membrane protein [Abditibacterium utsteinense]